MRVLAERPKDSLKDIILRKKKDINEGSCRILQKQIKFIQCWLVDQAQLQKQGMKRVVVTGMGMVSPLGGNLPQSWSALLNNQSGIAEYLNDPVLQNASPYNLSLVKDQHFQFKRWRTPHAGNRLNSFLSAAAAQALDNAKILSEQLDKSRVGICMGVMSSNLSKINEFAQESAAHNYININRLSMLHILSNIPAGALNVKYQFHGPSMTVSTACASGLSAIVEAYKWIKLGEADVALSGGAEDVYNPLCLNSSIRLQAMSTQKYDRPELASRPFDRDRSGFILGEGSGVVILQQLQHAKRRGAPILAEILGYGYTSDGYHLVRPKQSGQGQIASMQLALRMSNIPKGKISCVNVHATSTKAGDQIEANSIKRVFGQDRTPKVSAFKGAIGHTFAAAGALESILSIKCIEEGKIPKINNLVNPDTQGVDYVLQNYSGEVQYVLKNSFGFGGINVSAVFGKYHQ